MLPSTRLKRVPRGVWAALGLCGVLAAGAVVAWSLRAPEAPLPTDPWPSLRQAYLDRRPLLPWVQAVVAQPSVVGVAYAMLVVARCDHVVDGPNPPWATPLRAERDRWLLACRGLTANAAVRAALRAAAADLPTMALAVDGFETPQTLSGLAAVRAARVIGDGDLFVEALALLKPGDVAPLWPALADAQQPRQELALWQLAAWVETCSQWACDDAYYRWRLCAEMRRCEAPSGRDQVNAIAREQVEEATWIRVRESMRVLMTR